MPSTISATMLTPSAHAPHAVTLVDALVALRASLTTADQRDRDHYSPCATGGVSRRASPPNALPMWADSEGRAVTRSRIEPCKSLTGKYLTDVTDAPAPRWTHEGKSAVSLPRAQ